MRIELPQPVPPGGVVQVRTPDGSATVRWCGVPGAPAGPYEVEWTVGEAVVWGRQTGPVVTSTPAVSDDGPYIVLRGRLDLTPDGAGVLDLCGSLVLLEVVTPPPATTVGGLVEMRVSRDTVAVYPCLA